MIREPGFRASIAVLGAVLLLLGPALLQADGLIYPSSGQFTDLTITHWPAFEYLHDSIASFRSVPLWRTSILGGTPFAADPVSGLGYPPNWLSIVMPLEWFFKLIVAAHLFLGGWSMMRLARSFGAGWVGATLSGMAYAVAPRAMGHAGAGHLTLVEAWAWIPLIVLAARLDRRGARVASGAALGLCASADLRVAVFAAIGLALYVLLDPAAARMRRVAHLLAILFVAAWLSAAAWIPAQSLAGESTRAGLSPGEASAFSLPPEYLLGTLLASRGDPESLTYVGLAVLVTALIGVRAVWRGQRHVAVWLVALTALGAVVALGSNTPLYALLYRLPGVSLLRVPARAWILVSFAAALASGLGVDAWMRRPSEKRLNKKWLLVSWLVGSFALLFGGGGALIVFAGGQAGAQRVELSLIGLAIFLPLTIGLLVARSNGRLSAAHFGGMILIAIAVELIWVGWGQYRVVSRDEAFGDGRELAEYVRSATGDALYRIYSPSYSVPQHVAQAHGLELADGIDPLQLDRTVRFMQRATGVGAWSYSVTLPAFEGLERDDELRTLLSNITPDPMLLGVLNVKYVAAHFPIAHPDLIEVAHPGGAFVYENARAMPRAWVVGRVDVVASQAEAVNWLSSHVLSREAVVEGGPALQAGSDTSLAQIVVREPDRIEVTARGPGLLILSEVYERDWRASIDGVAAPIYPTDGVLRGVYLPEGQHQVEFVYEPIVVKAALAASAAGWGGWIVVWFVGYLIRRRRLAG